MSRDHTVRASRRPARRAWPVSRAQGDCNGLPATAMQSASLWVAAAALCWAPLASAQLQFDLPAPQLALNLSLSATASSIGPPAQFDAGRYFQSTAVGAAGLVPGQVYTLERAGALHQSYSFDGTEDDPGVGNGYADLHYDGQLNGRAAFGNLGVAVAMAQSGSGFWYASSPSGSASGMGGGSSTAESRASAADSFTVLSASRPLGAGVVVDFSIDVAGTVLSAAVADDGSPQAIGSLGVLRQVQVFRPGSVLPVFTEARDHWWQAGYEELGSRADVRERLSWLLPLQVGDQVALHISLVASVTNDGGVPPGGDPAFAGLFDASAQVDAMNSAHISLAPDAPDVQLVSASGSAYGVAPVPEPGSWAMMIAGLWSIGRVSSGRWLRKVS